MFDCLLLSTLSVYLSVSEERQRNSQFLIKSVTKSQQWKANTVELTKGRACLTFAIDDVLRLEISSCAFPTGLFVRAFGLELTPSGPSSRATTFCASREFEYKFFRCLSNLQNLTKSARCAIYTEAPWRGLCVYGTPDRIRTCDRRLRRPIFHDFLHLVKSTTY